MDDIPLSALFGLLAGLLIFSAFFSSSETGMMSINRYRLKHLANKQNKSAIRVSELLSRPDRLIGVILIGNNLVNILATMVAGSIAVKLGGDIGLAVMPIVLTIVMLIFAEVTPKTVAALKPERIAFPASWLLRPLLTVLYPLVWLINYISNKLARCFGVDPNAAHAGDHLHPEELRTVVDEAGDLIPDQHQGMLLNVLDLERATVEDIMVPRNEVTGLDLNQDIETIMQTIRKSDYTRLPVYEGDINNIIGVLHLRDAPRFIYGDDSTVSHEAIRRFAATPYFVPEATSLSYQLMSFQKNRSRMAIVVDEYGDVQGLVTLEDLLEEIVGDFTTNVAETESEEVSPLDDGWFLIDGTASIREINKLLDWKLPTEGPKTMNGLAMEYLESIPEGATSFQIGRYRCETVKVNEKMIVSFKVKRIG